MNLKERAKQLKNDIPAIFLALKKSRTPLPALIALTIHFIPKEQMDACKAEAQGLWQNGKPTRWWYAIPIILIWVLCLFLVISAFL